MMQSTHEFRCLLLIGLALAAPAFGQEQERDVFREQVAPILERRCFTCHNRAQHKGDFSLQTQAELDDSGFVIAGDPESSYLLEVITSQGGERPVMPKDSDPLSAGDVAAIRAWIKSGAAWPEGEELEAARVTDTDWWSWRPLARPAVPKVEAVDGQPWPRTPIDAFILAKLQSRSLSPSPPADRRTLIRRLYFDLIGLPPPPEEVEAFAADTDPQAYTRLVDRLLESPHYGERWARHWLDVVHYGDTHGYDKDKPRPNAWPYRDYVIRAFNNDKPYAQFVEEQIAGDVLWPDTVDGVTATGFIAAGPWDYIGHAEVPETKFDGQVARNLDRDDMVTAAMNTFCSLTIQCARCHHHKLDPVTMQEYYGLQAVFAAIDRADRSYDADPEVARRRVELAERQKKLQTEADALDKRVKKLAGPALEKLDNELAALDKQPQPAGGAKPEFGYHSQISPKADVTKWVQVDLGRATPIESIVYVGCHDNFNGIGHGFGFPVRYKIELADDAEFKTGVTMVVDHTGADVPNPGTTPNSVKLPPRAHARYVRVTATRLVLRKNDYIFALAELSVLTPSGENAALGKPVTSLDSIEAPVRWSRKNLVDGYFYGAAADPAVVARIAELNRQRSELLDRTLDSEDALRKNMKANADAREEVSAAIKALPPLARVYSGTVHNGSGNFRGRFGLGPREIHVLVRGDVTQPGELVQPGAVNLIPGVPATFDLPAGHSEGDRRAALAHWITRKDHPLTWRSIVNRVWLYHFGRGGQLPSHPELLDWLAVEFRDGGGSLKELHRLICNSAVYRQSSQAPAELLERATAVDADNRLLWRMNRRRLTAEEIRDAALRVAGRLDTTMGGPGFMDFVIEQPQHSPHYEYDRYDPLDAKTHRRAVYRFIVRSQPQPLMNVLDCADPSMSVPKRDETLTALQALSMLNNRFMVAMSEQFAERLTRDRKTPNEQVAYGFELVTGRKPTTTERDALTQYAQQHGLPNACRVLLNMNEFVFVD